jgi:DNA-binding transcriptional ArsR family regulator/GTPase SAR1 family protein
MADTDFSMGSNDIWELYGLKENPFSTNPLLVLGGVIPITCFIGREKELERITKQFRSKGGSRTLVVGDFGVGKTSFVNFARYKARERGHFSPIKEIGIQEGWSAQDFVISTLYAISISLQLTDTKNLLNVETLKKIESLTAIDRVVSRSGDLSFMGTGGGYSEERGTSSTIPFMALEDLLQTTIKEIYGKTNKEVILHYNNLERLSERSIRKVFEDLRDTFQMEHTHFVFVGNLSVEGIIQSMPRVASIFSERIPLGTMGYKEIEEILDTRLNQMKMSETVIKPYDSSAFGTLYNLYRGNIRDILNSFNTAILEATKDRPIVLDKNGMSYILHQVVETRFLSSLPPKARTILENILSAKKGEITNRAIAANTNTDRSNVSTYLRDLERAGCVYLKRRDGKDKFWSVRPEIKWILLQPTVIPPAKPDEKQARLL